MWTLRAVLLSRGQAFQMGTHLFLLGPLLYSSRSLAALLLDSHYKGSVLAWSLASRRSWGHGKPGLSFSARITAPHLPIPFCNWRSHKSVGALMSPGRRGGDPGFEAPRVT